jgi:hypothetical protein
MSKQTVYNILASKPVKVELALADDFLDEFSKVESEIEQFDTLIIQSMATARSSAAKYLEAAKKWQSVSSKGEKLEAMASDLGVALEPKYTSAIREAKEFAQSDLAYANKMITHIRQFYDLA